MKRKPGVKADALARAKGGKKAIRAVARAVKPELDKLRTNYVNPSTKREIAKLEADRELGDRQKLFAKFWAMGDTPANAALRAGYSEKSANTGWRLSIDPAIVKLYNAEKKLFEDAAQMTRQRVMDMLKEAYDMAKIQSESAVMVAAAREIGKMCGYYEPEVKININVGAKIEQLATLTDAQLLELIEQGGEIIPGESVRVIDVPALEAPK